MGWWCCWSGDDDKCQAQKVKLIGPSFDEELRTAGLSGLPFSWGDDGVIQFRDDVSQEIRNSVLKIYAVHDPSKPAVTNHEVSIDEIASVLKAKGYITDEDLGNASASA